MSLSELQELVMDREAWSAAIHGVAKSRTRLRDWTELNWTDTPQIKNFPSRSWGEGFRGVLCLNHSSYSCHPPVSPMKENFLGFTTVFLGRSWWRAIYKCLHLGKYSSCESSPDTLPSGWQTPRFPHLTSTNSSTSLNLSNVERSEMPRSLELAERKGVETRMSKNCTIYFPPSLKVSHHFFSLVCLIPIFF